MISRVFFAIIGIIFMIVILNKVKKKKFFEKESFYWMFASVITLILSIFPNIIIFLSRLVNIEYAPSLLFLVSIMFILYILFRMTEQMSLMKEQNKELAQTIVVLNKKIEEIKDNK